MTLFSGDAGFLTGYKTFHFTVSDVDYIVGNVRFVFTGGDLGTITYGTENATHSGIISAGHYTIDISNSASSITKIEFGGNGTTKRNNTAITENGTGDEKAFSIGIKASDVYVSMD